MAKLSSAFIYASQLTATAGSVRYLSSSLAELPAGEAWPRCSSNLKWKAMLPHYTVACALINLSPLSETRN